MTLRLALLLASTTALTGCGIGEHAALTTTTIPGVQISGIVHGGQAPVSGSVIQMWQVGTSAYASGATTLGSSTTTDPNGNFTLTGDYECTTAENGASTLVYITATGGNPGMTSGTNNTAILLIEPLGQCGNLTSSTRVALNEATTIAAAYALSGFMSASGNIGSTTGGAIGLTNAFATFNTLVDPTAGLVRSSAFVSGGIDTPARGDSILPTAELNTLANIISACVNSSSYTSMACSSLFTAATPTGGAPLTNVLGAALDIAHNPANNVSILYGLSTAVAPFQPAMTSPPNDFSVIVAYYEDTSSGWSTAEDGNGNLWVSDGSESLWEVGPTGMPSLNSETVSGDYANVAIDSNNNAWVISPHTGALSEFSATTTGSSTTINAAGGPFTALGLAGNSGYVDPIAIDASNNIWIGDSSNSSVVKVSSSGGLLSGTAGYTSSAITYPYGLVVDSSNNIWILNGGNGINLGGISVTELNSSGSVTYGPSASFSQGAGGKLGGFVAAPTPGQLWLGGIYGTTYYSFSSGSFTAYNAPSTYSMEAYGLAMDGAGNLWCVNDSQDGSQPGSIFMINGTTGVASKGYIGDGTIFFSYSDPTYIAGYSLDSVSIDPSGNVWTMGHSGYPVEYYAFFNSSPAIAYYGLFEYIGAAAPTVTPLSLAAKNNKIGQLP